MTRRLYPRKRGPVREALGADCGLGEADAASPEVGVRNIDDRRSGQGLGIYDEARRRMPLQRGQAQAATKEPAIGVRGSLVRCVAH